MGKQPFARLHNELIVVIADAPVPTIKHVFCKNFSLSSFTFGIFRRIRPISVYILSPRAGIPATAVSSTSNRHGTEESPPIPDQFEFPHTPVQSMTLSTTMKCSVLEAAFLTRIRNDAVFRPFFPPMSSFFKKLATVCTQQLQLSSLNVNLLHYTPLPTAKASDWSKILHFPEVRNHFSITSRYSETYCCPVGNDSARGNGCEESSNIFRPTSVIFRNHGLKSTTCPHSRTEFAIFGPLSIKST